MISAFYQQRIVLQYVIKVIVIRNRMGVNWKHPRFVLGDCNCVCLVLVLVERELAID